MKILRLSTFLDFGGIESKMANLSSWNDENDWLFVAIGKGGEAEEKIKSNDKQVWCLHLTHRIPSPVTLYKLFRFLKKEKPDVLHTSGAEANFFGFIAGKLAGVPTIVVEEIGIPKHSSKAKKIFGFIFKNANWVVGESKIVVDHIRDSFQLGSSKTKVVHNFGLFNYDLTTIDVRKDKETFSLLMISRLEPVKNIEGVLNVLGKLVKETSQKIKLTIAGTGTSEAALKEIVKTLHLEQNVEFVGFISDPYPYLVNSDLYILNSFTEGFSNSLVEAMYSKTLSLSTKVGAAPEIIQDSINGFLVPSDDEDALFYKLKMIKEMNAEQRKKIGEKGRQTIVENFSLDKHVEELMKLYKS